MATFFCPQGGRSQRGSTVASIPLMAILKRNELFPRALSLKLRVGLKVHTGGLNSFVRKMDLKLLRITKTVKNWLAKSISPRHDYKKQAAQL